MIGLWTKIKKGTVEIEHFSTSSLIKITFTHEFQKNQQGDMDTAKTVIWFEYDEFEDLMNAIDQINEINS